MKNLTKTEELLESIKNGKAVESSMINGWIHTPAMPEEVFNIEYNSKGEEVKRSINPAEWIKWINSVAEASADQEADIEQKSIVGTRFHSQCESAYASFMKHLSENKGYTGAVWLEKGTPYSIPFEGANIITAKVALEKVLQNSIQPKNFDNIADRFNRESERTMRDIISGR